MPQARLSRVSYARGETLSGLNLFETAVTGEKVLFELPLFFWRKLASHIPVDDLLPLDLRVVHPL
jgi:hypothetical protein